MKNYPFLLLLLVGFLITACTETETVTNQDTVDNIENQMHVLSDHVGNTWEVKEGERTLVEDYYIFPKGAPLENKTIDQATGKWKIDGYEAKPYDMYITLTTHVNEEDPDYARIYVKYDFPELALSGEGWFCRRWVCMVCTLEVNPHIGGPNGEGSCKCTTPHPAFPFGVCWADYEGQAMVTPNEKPNLVIYGTGIDNETPIKIE